MYARRVSMKLKPNAKADFEKRIHADVIPLLRKQTGFRDEIVFSNPDGIKAFAISLWDRKESADAYEKNGYAQVQKLLEGMIEGTPNVAAYEVTASTLSETPATPTK